MFLDLVLARNRRKWSIYTEILLATYSVAGSFEDYENENRYTITSTEIGYSYLKLSNLVRYKYPIGNLFLFFSGGISSGLSLSETNYKKETSKFFSTISVVEGMAVENSRKYEQFLVLGTGLKYDKFSIEMRYEKGNGMSKYINLNSSTNRYYLLFGYRF